MATECVSCGDDPGNAPQPLPHEPAENYCCSWECYAVLLKSQRDEAKERIATIRRTNAALRRIA